MMFCSFHFDFLQFFSTSISIYRKTCLNWTPLGLTNLFSLDRYLVYSGFGLDRFHCIYITSYTYHKNTQVLKNLHQIQIILIFTCKIISFVKVYDINSLFNIWSSWSKINIYNALIFSLYMIAKNIFKTNYIRIQEIQALPHKENGLLSICRNGRNLMDIISSQTNTVFHFL